jgi:cystathionine beta-lyase
VDPEWLVWLPGLVTGLNLTCRAAAVRGEEVLTAVPVYPPFLTAPRLSRRRLATLPLIREAGRWTLDFDRLAAMITPATRLFLLCNPHNPVGTVFTRRELATLAGICDRHNLIICSDEIHCGLVLDPDKVHVPIATLDPAIAHRTVTLMSPSKTFNLPGCAFAVIPAEPLRRKFRRAMAGVVPGPNLFSATAALAAYRDGAPWRRALLDYLRRNRDLVSREVNRMPGLAMDHVEATYLAWIDTRAAGIAAPGKFFEQAGVGLGDGVDFGGPGFVRLGFACPRATLAEALARMSRALL